jgi:hypothetical protein
VLAVVGRYGDRAMDLVWRHKGALAVTVVLAAFLADPGPFLAGTSDLAGVVAGTAMRPLAALPGQVVEAARRTLGTLVVVLLLGSLGLGLVLKGGWKDARSAIQSSIRRPEIPPDCSVPLGPGPGCGRGQAEHFF